MRPREEGTTAVADDDRPDAPFPDAVTAPAVLPTFSPSKPAALGSRTAAPNALDRATNAPPDFDAVFAEVLTSDLFDEALLVPFSRPASPPAAAPVELEPPIDTTPTRGGGGGGGQDAAGGGGGGNTRGGDAGGDGARKATAIGNQPTQGRSSSHDATTADGAGHTTLLMDQTCGDFTGTHSGDGTFTTSGSFSASGTGEVDGDLAGSYTIQFSGTGTLQQGSFSGTVSGSLNGTFSGAYVSDGAGGFAMNTTYSLQEGPATGSGAFSINLSDLSFSFSGTIERINVPPVGAADQYAALESAALAVTDPAEGLLANDNDPDCPDNDHLEVASHTQPVDGQGQSAGSVSVNDDGTFTFDAAEDYYGWATFTYYVSDGIDTADEATTVTIGVNALRIELIDGPFQVWHDVTDETIEREVGEEVAIRAVLAGPNNVQIVDNIIDLTDGPTWNVPGMAIKDYDVGTDEQTGASYGRVIPLTDVDKRGVATTFYWIDDGTGREVAVSAEIEGANGKQLGTATESVTFNVIRPSAVVETVTSSVNVDSYDNDKWVAQFGDWGGTPAEVGIQFEETSNLEDFTLTWVQMVNSHDFMYRKPLEGYMRYSHIDHVLDTHYPMPKVDLDGLPTEQTMTHDSPTTFLQESWDYLDRRDEFSTYLMYTPVGDGDVIPVPLLRIDWYWQARATRAANGNWVMDTGSASHSINPTAVSTYLHPEWAMDSDFAIQQIQDENDGELGAPMPT